MDGTVVGISDGEVYEGLLPWVQSILTCQAFKCTGRLVAVHSLLAIFLRAVLIVLFPSAFGLLPVNTWVEAK